MGGRGSGGGGLRGEVLLDNCSLKGFSKRKFWHILLVGCGWLLVIPRGPWMVAVDSWCSVDDSL